MLVVAFDLSSTCIGVCVAKVDLKKQPIKLKTVSIIPQKPSGKDFGFTTKESKKIAKNGKEFQAFLYPHETIISQREALDRIRMVKSEKHLGLLKNIGQQCGELLFRLKPHVVLLEKNASFNGILTTKLLAEIAGGIYFYCGATDTSLCDYHVETVRAYLRQTIPVFDRANEDGKDVLDTKWEMYCRLRTYYKAQHPKIVLDRITMDESDALALFYYWSHQLKEDIV